MHKGHLDQHKQNIQSTGNNATSFTLEDLLDDYFPEWHPEDDPHERTHLVCAAVFQPTGKFYSDLTGKFVAPSSTGNNYVLIVYDYDSNSIQAIAMPSRSKSDHLTALRTAYSHLMRAGCRPRLHIMDNECSDLVKTSCARNTLRSNSFPRTPTVATPPNVQSGHSKITSSQASAAPTPVFPSTYCQPTAKFGGVYDFNRTPIAPPGCKVLIHEKPHNRGTWAPHASEGWYLGPALDAYRCFTVYSTDTRHARTADTVQFLPHAIPVPVASAADLIAASLRDILHVLTNPTATTPTLPPTQRRMLQDLTEIFSPDPPPPAPVDPATISVTERIADDMVDDPIILQPARVVAPTHTAPASTAGAPGALLRVPPRLVSPPTSPSRRTAEEPDPVEEPAYPANPQHASNSPCHADAGADCAPPASDR